MNGKRLIGLAATLAALALFATALPGTASAAGKDYSSPDGICYTSGWCHWNEVCYDAFGGCYFDFWCPQGATSPGQCLYYGGFQPYASAASSASGPGVNDSSSTSGGGSTANTSIASGSSDTIGSSFNIGTSGEESTADASTASGSSDTVGSSFDIGTIDSSGDTLISNNSDSSCLDSSSCYGLGTTTSTGGAWSQYTYDMATAKWEPSWRAVMNTEGFQGGGL